jgi:pimeloyl-ACP methyl ester carboxylesterase
MATDKDQQQGYASVNGLDIYYEIRGSGKPLVLLPGGFMTVEAMGELVPQLAATRRVIGVELQGHGHTADIARAALRVDGRRPRHRYLCDVQR